MHREDESQLSDTPSVTHFSAYEACLLLRLHRSWLAPTLRDSAPGTSAQMSDEPPCGESGAKRKACYWSETVRRSEAHEIQAGNRAFEIARQYRRVRRRTKSRTQRGAQEAEALDIGVVAGRRNQVIGSDLAAPPVGTGKREFNAAAALDRTDQMLPEEKFHLAFHHGAGPPPRRGSQMALRHADTKVFGHDVEQQRRVGTEA